MLAASTEIAGKIRLLNELDESADDTAETSDIQLTANSTDGHTVSRID